MNHKALFVNSDPTFAGQIPEAGMHRQRVTSSFLQGLEWIADEGVSFSGIYLNPVDSNFSALQFLSSVMKLRPATPIYILDEIGDLSPQNFSALSDKFKITGIVDGAKAVIDSLNVLQADIPETLKDLKERRPAPKRHPGYLAIPLLDFIYAKHFSANVFVEDDLAQLRFFAMEGSEVDLEYLSYLSRKTEWLYIEESSLEARMASFRLVESSYLDPAYLSPSWRTAETFYRAKRLLDQVKKHGVSEALVEDTYSVFQNLFQLTSQIGSKSSGLHLLMDQAKQSDRAIQSVILSVLLCKKLKYEKQSIVETLGIASLLQDVSLYRSPFGDIADLHPDQLSAQAKHYYLNHPNASAELVSSMTMVPEVTLQIIRQQHERPDRTGFPSRVGGAQLQPLAEILSLINSHLQSKETLDQFETHYSEQLTVPFRELLMALKRFE